MIWFFALFLLICWIASLATHATGIFIHALLIAAVSLALLQVYRHKRKPLPRYPAPFFLTEFAVSQNWDFPDDFKIKAWPGLILCQVIGRGAAEARLLAWWDAKASYEDYWAIPFQRRLRLAKPVFQGPMVRRELVEVAWWEQLKSPIGLYSIFISLVALVTNIIQFKTFLDWAWAVPDTTLATKEGAASSIVVVVGEPYTLTVQAYNNISSEAEVDLSQPTISPSPTEGGLTIAETHSQRRKLAVSSPVDIAYHLMVEAPGNYEIDFHGTQHSGQLIGWQPVHGDLKCTIEAWPQVDERPSISYERFTPEGIGVYQVTARHGHPIPDRTLTYRAAVAGDNLVFVGVNRGSVTQNTSNGGVATIVWKATPTITVPCKPQEFELTVKSSVTRDEKYWKALVEKFDIGAG
jgi:hypothetical protein